MSRLDDQTNIYEVPSPVSIQTILAPLVGGIFFLVGLLHLLQMLVGEPNIFSGTARSSLDVYVLGPYLVDSMFVLLGAVFVHLGWREFTGSPSEIRVHHNGTIEFKKQLSRTVIHASDISSVELTFRDSYLEGMDNRVIRIKHTNGTVSVRYLYGAKALVADLTALNPAIQVTTDWLNYGAWR